jgi:hypothetical protein
MFYILHFNIREKVYVESFKIWSKSMQWFPSEIGRIQVILNEFRLSFITNKKLLKMLHSHNHASLPHG